MAAIVNGYMVGRGEEGAAGQLEALGRRGHRVAGVLVVVVVIVVVLQLLALQVVHLGVEVSAGAVGGRRVQHGGGQGRGRGVGHDGAVVAEQAVAAGHEHGFGHGHVVLVLAGHRGRGRGGVVKGGGRVQVKVQVADVEDMAPSTAGRRRDAQGWLSWASRTGAARRLVGRPSPDVWMSCLWRPRQVPPSSLVLAARFPPPSPRLRFPSLRRPPTNPLSPLIPCSSRAART